MPAVVDSLDNHLAAAGSIDRAALLPGMYLGWCVRLGLVTDVFKDEHERAVLRLNYGEETGVELLVSCGGNLYYDYLTAQGRAFTQHYYAQYGEDWGRVFGADHYSVENSWATYDSLAPLLTQALYSYTGKAKTRKIAKRSRWKFWQ